MIEFRDVAVCYSPLDRYPVNALDKIDLKVADGEWVFLVGPSGAGKSTLLKLIYGDAQVSSGRVLVDDRDVTQMLPHQIPILRRGIGVIFQDFQLLPQKTVWENVAFALQVIGAPQKRLVRDVPRALETVGLQDKTESRPHQLSGGERQRVAIARAIVNNPRLLLADEPTGNLDPQTGQDIIDVLRRINQSGTTVMMATHDRAVVDRLKLRVVRLSEGRVSSDEAQGVYHLEDDVLHQPAALPSTAASPPQSTLAPLQIPLAAATPAAATPAAATPASATGDESGDAKRTAAAPLVEMPLNPPATAPHFDDARPKNPTRPSVAPDASVPESNRFKAPWLDEPSEEISPCDAAQRDAAQRDVSSRDKRTAETARDAATHYRALRQMPPGRGAREERKDAANGGEASAPENRESPFESPQRNEAPLGSPENPLVQFEPPARAPRRES